MSSSNESLDKETKGRQSDTKILANAVVTETNLFQRSTRNGTFANDTSEEFYAPIDSYEGRHRYDPEFQWDPKEEKRVVRKVWSPRHESRQTSNDACVTDVLRRLTSGYVLGCA